MINICNLPSNKEYTMNNVNCRILSNSKFDVSLKGFVKLESDTKFVFINMDSNLRIEFEIYNELDRELFNNYLTRNFYCVSEIVNIYKGDKENIDTMFLHAVFFMSISYYPDFNIILSENVKNVLKKRKIAVERFADNFIISDGANKSMLAYTNGDYQEEIAFEDKVAVAVDSDEEKSVVENDKNDSIFLRKDNKYNNRIKLYGNHTVQGYSMVLYVKMSEKTSDDVILVADKIVFAPVNVPCMKLAVCDLNFTEEAHFISKKTQELFVNTKAGYLNIWEQYANLEGDIMLKKANETGVLVFSNINPVGDKYHLTLSENCRDRMHCIRKGDSLDFSGDVPEYVLDSNVKWENFRKKLLNQKISKVINTRNCYKISDIDRNNYTIVVDTEGATPGKTAVLSIASDLTQIMRRENAREMIYKGESANPKLAFIIEGVVENDVMSLRKVKHKKYPALTNNVRYKIFPDNLPTDNQREAIEIAINTPDIALILGPPGTGKTTVINAIVERLNEIDNQSVSNKGKVLISSTQHDAVINITERMTINGLPTPKFGKKIGEDDDSSDRIITKWCENIKNQIASKYSFIDEIHQKSTLEKIYNMYLLNPSSGTAKNLLIQADRLNTNYELSSIITELLREYSVDERESSFETQDDILKSIRRIRTNPSSFSDDGPENVMDLYIKLDNIDGFSKVHQDIMAALSKAARIKHNSFTDELGKSLTDIKNRLIEMYLPKPKYQKEQVDERIVDLYKEIKNMAVSAENEEQSIILSLYSELDNNITLVEEQLSDYSYAFSSTLQQSVSDNVKRAKFGDSWKTKSDSLIKYDTVIIDEAARATPGDLLIPLTQASKRIILVGDPHQLTHIYNEDILNVLGDNNDLAGLKNIEKSMFSYMWEQAEKMEKSDGVKRRIVLNNQYRTHPLLGNFVSDNFYKQSNEGYNSPLPAEKFKQDIYDSPLRWIDMPFSLGPMSGKTTYSRECEADYIINRIIELKTSEKGRKYSYGIITFYRGQTSLLKKKMKEKYPDYERDNIRIGSVDAFQGMEFDIIFLSVVRTGRESFGFLTSVNRLCVAMSRQKKLLVVVGDSHMFSGEKAEKEIPAMKHLLELCKKEGWIENYVAN